MKTNKILLFSFAAAMMAGCADDEFVNNNGMNGNEGVNGKLVEAGLLGVGRVGDDAETRAYSPNGKFVWMPDGLISTTGAMDDERLNQRIGLCWTGVAENGFGAVAVADQKVYTNYEYEHVGWLDENASSPKVDPCDKTKLLNGAFIQNEGEPVASFNGSEYASKGGRWNAYYYGEQLGKYENDSEWAGKEDEYSGNLNLGRGVFSTKNASVFEGEYLAYYPYTNDFKKGQIVAHEPTTFMVDQSADRYAAAWDKAFSIGYISNYAGGNAASGIAARTLSGFLIAKLYNYAMAVPANKQIKTVIFYSEGQGILYKQDLNAKACVDALKTGSLGNGKDLYFTGSPLFHETTNAIVANLCNTNGAENAKECFTVQGVATEPGETSDYAWVALPVLPQTINDLKVILIDVEDKSCTLPMTAGDVIPNGALTKEINLAECTFVNEYLAVDEASFLSAMEKIKKNGETASNLDANKVKLLKDITMTFDANNSALESYLGSGNYAGVYNSLFFDKNITIYSACGAKLIVAADTKMHIKNLESQIIRTATDRIPKLTIDVPVVVEGAGCCGNKVAKLSVGGKQDLTEPCTVIFNKGVENFGTFALGNNAKGKTNVKVNGTLFNKFDEFAVERQKTKDAAQVYLLGGGVSGSSELAIETLENEGVINSLATSIEINKEDVIVGVSNMTSEKRVVETTIETLKNKVTKDGDTDVEETGIVNIGGLTEIYVGNLTNEDEASLIKTDNVKEGEAQSLIDGRLTVTGAATNNGIIDNDGVTNLEEQPMENNGLVIDQLSGQLGGYYVDNGNGSGKTMAYGGTEYVTDLPVKGIYVSKVATKERFRFALTDAVEEPSCNIIEIVDADVSSFNLVELDPDGKLGGKDVYVATGDKPKNKVCIKAWEDGEGDKKVAVEKSFGHCVTVRAQSELTVKDGILSTVKDVNVEKNAAFIAAVAYNSDKSDITIGGNLNNEGTTTHDANILTVNEDLKNRMGASFTSNQKFDVKGSVETAGDFSSNGDGNTVGVNFAQTGGGTSFNYKTTTDVAGEFSCTDGTFTRKALGTNGFYRATVNVGSLGTLTGTNNGGWPTVKKQ